MRVAYDIEQMKPACAILQALLGCDPAIASRFLSEHWLVSPTPGMKVYDTTPEELAKLVKITELTHESP